MVTFSDNTMENVPSQEQALTRQYYAKWKSTDSSPEPHSVPSFYRRILPSDNDLQFRLLEEARGMALSKLNGKILDNEEIQDLWNLFQQHAKSSSQNSEAKADERHYLTYTSYATIRRTSSPKVQSYLRPTTFLALICTENARDNNLIRVADLFNYVVRKVWLERTRLALSLYDLEGNGFLKEADLEQYIDELIPTIDSLARMDPEFKKFYVCSVLRKFFFFLDPGKQGKVKITRMLGSTLMQELMDVRESSEKSEKKNWFTLEASMDIYNDYLSLDRKRNGLLSREEFINYPKASLTEAFVKRVYEECLTYEGEMDYKTFLDVVLALSNKNEPPAVRFLFRILDVNHQGAIDRQTVYFFYKDIQKLLVMDNVHAPTFADVVAEIFDMIPSREYGFITLHELIQSRLGGTVVGLLIDKDCFLAYEFREQQLAPS